MSYIRYKKIGNKEYAYKITAYWDKEKKYSKQKSEYIGVVVDKAANIFREVKRRRRDKEGKIIPNVKIQAQYKEKEIVSFGSGFLFKAMFADDDIGQILSGLLSSEKLNMLRNLLTYRLVEGSAMYLAKDWYEGDILKHISSSAMSGQSISNFLKELGSERLQRDFFNQYLPIATQDTKEGLIIDGTAMPNDINIPISEFGYNSGNIDRQIKFLSVISADNNMPLYFRYNNGSIADISTLKNTIQELKNHNAKSKAVLLDAGFYCNENIELLQKNDINFIIRLPKGRNLFKKIIDKKNTIESISNAVKVSEKRIVFIAERKIKLNKKYVYAYIVLDPKKKADMTNKYLSGIIDDGQNTSVDEVKKTLNQQGIFVIISSKKQLKDNILNLYYLRQQVERMFAFSKSDLNLLPIRIHSESTLRGYLFLSFLLSYFFMQFHKKLKKEFTVEQAFIIVSALKAKIYDLHILIQEPTKKQKRIFELIGCNIPDQIARE